MKRLIASLILGIALLINPIQAENNTKVLNSVRVLKFSADDYEGQITNGNHCSVESINQAKSRWLTAAHCVADDRDEEVVWDRDYTIAGFPAYVLDADIKKDLAVLVTPGLNVPALKLAQYGPYLGQAIRVVGHPVGLDDRFVFWGRVANPYAGLGDASRYVAFDMTACGGNSGSPVVNSRDEIVSVLQVGYGQPCGGFTGGATWVNMLTWARKYFG